MLSPIFGFFTDLKKNGKILDLRLNDVLYKNYKRYIDM